MGRFINEDTRQYLRLLGQVATLGLTMVFATMIGFGLGYLADSHWPDIAPWGKAAGFLIGLTAGFRNLFRVAMRFAREKRQSHFDYKDDENDRPPTIH